MAVPSEKAPLFTPATLRQIAEQFGTPVYVYDADTLRAQLEKLKRFDHVRFAQKACSNVHVLRVLREAGALVDCVSLGELERAVRAGFEPGQDPAQIVYTADVLTKDALDRLVETKVPMNAGSIDMLAQLGTRSPGHAVWLRMNPGFGSGHSKKTNTGGESSKHGIWHEQLPDALRVVDHFGLDLVGFHMHIGSGADMTHLERVCDAMVNMVVDSGRDVRAISGGGGLSIPYRSHESNIDPQAYFERWHAARQRLEVYLEHPVSLELEPGRYLAGPAGVLVTEVRATKSMGGNHFTLVDAGFNDLMRASMYGAYHEITLLPQDGAPRATRPTVVAGPLCESGDVFTQTSSSELDPRPLPEAEVGDLLVFHDAGAYGASMSSNYNSRPLVPEVLIDGGKVQLIRRRQTIADLLQLELDIDQRG